MRAFLVADMTRLEQLKERRRMYLEAEAAILRGQEYTIGDRKLRRPDLSAVRAAIQDLDAEIAALEKSVGRVRRVVFIE